MRNFRVAGQMSIGSFEITKPATQHTTLVRKLTQVAKGTNSANSINSINSINSTRAPTAAGTTKTTRRTGK